MSTDADGQRPRQQTPAEQITESIGSLNDTLRQLREQDERREQEKFRRQFEQQQLQLQQQQIIQEQLRRQNEEALRQQEEELRQLEIERAKAEVEKAKAEAEKARLETEKAKVVEKTESGTAVIEAAEIPLIKAAKAGDAKTVKRLMAGGIDPNVKDENGNTPMMGAAKEGHTTVVHVLLDRGADVNAKNNYGGTALMVAADKGHTAIVATLLAKGADVNAKEDTMGASAHLLAAQNGHTATVMALLAKGADVNAKDNALGWTALMAAASNDHTDTVEALLAKGADMNAKSHAGQTALRLAADKGHTAIVQLLKQTEAGISDEQKKRIESEQAKAELAEVKVDIEQVPSVSAKAKKDAYAVVVGIEKYTDLVPPDYAVRDAKWVKEYLIHVLGYPEENIQLLTNEGATGNRMKSAFETWLPNQDPKGSVFVYYSGHGAPDPATGESYLVPADGSPSDLKTTGYPLKRLAQALGKLPAKEIVVVMDSCFSGQPGTRSVIAKGTKPMVIAQEGPWAALGERGIVFTAGNQVSTVYEEKKHGLFTYFFLKGLQGAADLNGDGTIQAQELFAYLRPEVVKTAKRQNVRQEPGFWPPAEQFGPRASRALATIR